MQMNGVLFLAREGKMEINLPAYVCEGRADISTLTKSQDHERIYTELCQHSLIRLPVAIMCKIANACFGLIDTTIVL